MFDFFTDDSFEIEKTLQYDLSIQVSLDGFSFTVLDSLIEKVVAFKTTPLKISNEILLVRHLKDWLESEGFFKRPFKNVRILVYTAKFTLVPEEFSSEKLSENLNSLLFFDDANIELTENKISVLDARLIFPVQRELVALFYQFFKNNKKILHPLSVFLSKPVIYKKKNSAVIITTQKYFYLVVYRNGNLLLANSFQYIHQTDLIYNVLNSFHQLNTARNETELFVCDVTNKNTGIDDLLKPYFNQLSKLKTERIVNNDILNHSLQLYLSTN